MKDLFHYVPVVILALDSALKLRYANALAEGVLGRSADALVGADFSSLCERSPDWAFKKASSLEESAGKRGVPCFIEFHDGQGGKFLGSTVICCYGEGATPSGYILSISPVLASECRCINLDTAEMRLRDAVAVIPAAFGVYDADDRLVEFNDSFRRACRGFGDKLSVGITYDELVRNLIPPTQTIMTAQEREQWVVDRTRDHRSPTDEPVERKLADGRWHEVHTQVSRDGGIITFRMDVTEHKRLAYAHKALSKIVAAPRMGLGSKVQAVLKLGSEVLKLDWGAVGRVQGDALYLDYAHALPSNLEEGEQFQLQGTLAGDTARKAGVSAWPDLANSPWRESDAATKFGIASYIGSRLVFDGCAYGVLSFGGAKPRSEPFTRGEIELVEVFADWIATEIGREHDLNELRTLRAQFERQAMTDPLTGLGNRRTLDARAEQELYAVRRYDRIESLVLFDIDDFKVINDQHGHKVGDAVLRMVGEVCRQGTRIADVAVRWGGEEFVLLLPETDLEGAVVVAERLREAIATSFAGEDEDVVQVTASFGVTELRASDVSIDDAPTPPCTRPSAWVATWSSQTTSLPQRQSWRQRQALSARRDSPPRPSGACG